MTSKEIIYGKQACLEALRNKERKIVEIWISNNSLVKEIPSDLPYKLVDESFLTNKTAKQANHQGIVISANRLESVELIDLIHAEKSLIIVLDQITDPQNLGAILRSAAVFNAGGIVLQRYAGLLESSVLPRVASGGYEHVPLVPVVNISRSLSELKEGGYWCYGLSEKANISMSQANLKGKIVLVIGSEGKGLRSLTEKSCDVLLKIPTSPNFSTLNASQATSIAMYEVFRQNFS